MLRVPPVALLAAAALAQHLVAGRREWTPSSVQSAAAGSLAVPGAGLLAVSVGQFRRHRTTTNPIDPARASVLVTTGANRLSRNPMYVAMAGLLLAHAVLRRSWTAVVPAAVFVLLIDRLQVPAEEAALREQFGDEFDRYRDAVPRWLGRQSRPRRSRVAG